MHGEQYERETAELDYARVLLMLSVIAAHAASSYIFSESRISLFGMNLAYLINQAARCSVPGFIILSGASLGLGKTEYSIGSFYISRMKKVVFHISYGIRYILPITAAVPPFPHGTLPYSSKVF